MCARLRAAIATESAAEFADGRPRARHRDSRRDPERNLCRDLDRDPAAKADSLRRGCRGGREARVSVRSRLAHVPGHVGELLGEPGGSLPELFRLTGAIANGDARHAGEPHHAGNRSVDGTQGRSTEPAARAFIVGHSISLPRARALCRPGAACAVGP